MMESRKVQLAGGSTFTVSLPKQWAREHGVDAGSEVALRSHEDGTLLVQVDPGSGDEGRPAVDVDRHGDVPLPELVQALYAGGHDEFALVGGRATEPETVRTVERAASDLVGLTLVEAGDDGLVFRNALDPGDVSIPQTVMQLRRTACGMFEDAVAAVLDGDAATAERVVARDDDVDRLFGVVARSFRRSLVDMREVDRLGLDRPALFDHYRAAGELERVGDQAERLARTVDGGHDGVDGDLAEALEERSRTALAILDEATGALLEDAALDVATGLRRRRETFDESTAALEARLAQEGVAFGHPSVAILQRGTRVADAGATVAEAAVQSALRQRT